MTLFGNDGDEGEHEEDDLRAQLQANFDRLDSGELTSENAATLEIKPAPKPNTTQRDDTDGAANGRRQGEGGRQQTGQPATSPATGGQAQPSSGDRVRNADGTFAKAPDQPAATGLDAQQRPQTPASNSTQAPQTQPGQADPAAPASLSDSGREAWKSLHPEIRQHVADVEARRQAYERDFAEHIAPVHALAQREGVDWKEGIGRLVAAQNYLDRDPISAMLWLAQAYKVDVDELADRAAGIAPTGQPVPPQQQTPNPIEQRLGRLETTLTQQQQREQAAEEARSRASREAITREFNTFASSEHAPHWAKLQDDVYQHIPLVRQSNPGLSVPEIIKAAYERAAWAHPEVRQELMRQEREREQAATRQQRGTQVRHARAAQILTSHGGSHVQQNGGSNADMDLRAQLEADWDAVASARA